VATATSARRLASGSFLKMDALLLFSASFVFLIRAFACSAFQCSIFQASFSL
jgi:hypothetical protein